MDSGTASSLGTLGHAPATRFPVHPRNAGEEPEEALDPLPQGMLRALLPTRGPRLCSRPQGRHLLPAPSSPAVLLQGPGSAEGAPGSPHGAVPTHTLPPPALELGSHTPFSLNHAERLPTPSSQPSELCSPGIRTPTPRGSPSWPASASCAAPPAPWRAGGTPGSQPCAHSPAARELAPHLPRPGVRARGREGTFGGPEPPPHCHRPARLQVRGAAWAREHPSR